MTNIRSHIAGDVIQSRFQTGGKYMHHGWVGVIRVQGNNYRFEVGTSVGMRQGEQVVLANPLIQSNQILSADMVYNHTTDEFAQHNMITAGIGCIGSLLGGLFAVGIGLLIAEITTQIWPLIVWTFFGWIMVGVTGAFFQDEYEERESLGPYKEQLKNIAEQTFIPKNRWAL